MLVILTEQQILPTQKVCNGCLMANSAGLPRWDKGQLNCGRLMEKASGRTLPTQKYEQKACGQVYECQMGFRLTDIS